MRQIITERPYQFVPPYHGTAWQPLMRALLPHYLRRGHGIASVECRGVERLRASIDAGHGVLLTPNHCRPPDPFVLGELSRCARQPVFIVASWHLFTHSRLQTWALRRAGAFSIYREGMDRAAVNTAVEILATARRPLVIFPEGLVTRTNDLLGGLMEGTALIARSAAKRRAKGQSGQASPNGRAGDAAVKAPGSGKIVVHPVALRYFFAGDLGAAVDPVLSDIERRLTWRPRPGDHLFSRIVRIGEALLSLKEVEYLGKPQAGTLAQRLGRLIDRLLAPLEEEWLAGAREPHTAGRVKRLRQAILPDLVKGELDEAERARRWQHLADLYLAQQLANYPPDYIRSRPLRERVLETVERFEEDLTDTARVHRPMRVVVQVGEAIEVSPERERTAAALAIGPPGAAGAKASGDPLMQRIEEQLRTMLASLAAEAGEPLPLPPA